ADPRARALYAAVVERLRAAPGVLGATFTSHALLSNSSSIGVATTEGEAVPEPGSATARPFVREHTVWHQLTGPQFFTTIQVPILRGRSLDERDVAGVQRTAVVNVLL